MRRCTVPVLLLLAVGGCSSGPSSTTLVPNDPIAGTGTSSPPVGRVSYTPATVESAARVDQLGQKIVMANKPAGVRAVHFMTVGSPQPMLLHRGTDQILISEGLVRRCATDGQLAALLAYELARLVAERESLAAAGVRQPNREPPPDVRIGNDNAGSFGPADMTRQAELARFQPPGQHEPTKPITPPEPRTLADAYLKNAGFAPGELEAVAALLQSGDSAPGLQKQLLATPPAAH